MRVVVCGAGVAGLTVAWWLHRAAWDVVIVDKTPEPSTTGHVMQLDATGYSVLAKMGLLRELNAIDRDITVATCVDHSGTPTAQVRLPRPGERSATIMRGDLARSLHTVLPRAVDLRFGTSVRGVRQDDNAVRVLLSDGTELRADLLVGADGLHSQIRRITFGSEATCLRPLGLDMAAYSFRHPELARTLEGYQVLTGRGTAVSVLPLGGDEISVSLMHRADAWTRPRDIRARLLGRNGTSGWIVDNLITRCPPDAYFDHLAQVELSAWSKGRVVLIGDACAALASPNVSTALTSAYELTAALWQAPTLPVALERYECALRPAVRRSQSARRRAARWIAPTAKRDLRLQNVARTLSTAPALSRLFASALGLA